MTLYKRLRRALAAFREDPVREVPPLAQVPAGFIRRPEPKMPAPPAIRVKPRRDWDIIPDQMQFYEWMGEHRNPNGHIIGWLHRNTDVVLGDLGAPAAESMAPVHTRLHIESLKRPGIDNQYTTARGKVLEYTGTGEFGYVFCLKKKEVVLAILHLNRSLFHQEDGRTLEKYTVATRYNLPESMFTLVHKVYMPRDLTSDVDIWSAEGTK